MLKFIMKGSAITSITAICTFRRFVVSTGRGGRGTEGRNARESHCKLF